MKAPLSDNSFLEADRWLADVLDLADLCAVVPEGDPLRVWWSPQDSDPVRSLLDVVGGAEDTLTLFALIQRARLKGVPPPPRIESLLARKAVEAARTYRTQTYPGGYHAFLSYSHRDMERATAVVELLTGLGVRLFQDVRDIPAGASIVAVLHAQMSATSRAVLLVTEHYVRSAWVHREMSHLIRRRADGQLTLLPVLLDDIALPELLADTFTIDLRGFRGIEDRVWAEERLKKLAAECSRKVTA
jgi:hypothetical protein